MAQIQLAFFISTNSYGVFNNRVLSSGTGENAKGISVIIVLVNGSTSLTSKKYVCTTSLALEVLLTTYNFWDKSCSAMEVISFPTHCKYLNKLCFDLSQKRNGLNMAFSFSFVWLTISTVPHLPKLCTLSLFKHAYFHYFPPLLSHCLLSLYFLYMPSSQYPLQEALIYSFEARLYIWERTCSNFLLATSFGIFF